MGEMQDINKINCTLYVCTIQILHLCMIQRLPDVSHGDPPSSAFSTPFPQSFPRSLAQLHSLRFYKATKLINWRCLGLNLQYFREDKALLTFSPHSFSRESPTASVVPVLHSVLSAAFQGRVRLRKGDLKLTSAITPKQLFNHCTRLPCCPTLEQSTSLDFRADDGSDLKCGKQVPLEDQAFRKRPPQKT